MWTYTYSNENYLEHRLVNGRTVKYIARVTNGKGGYRYFYTNEAYRGYLNRGKSTTRTLKDGTVRISKYGNKSSQTTAKTIKKPSVSKEYEEELAYNSKKNTTTNVSPKGPSTKTTSDGPVIFTVNKDTGKTELVSGAAEIVQKGKNLIEELLKKIGR